MRIKENISESVIARGSDLRLHITSTDERNVDVTFESASGVQPTLKMHIFQNSKRDGAREDLLLDATRQKKFVEFVNILSEARRSGYLFDVEFKRIHHSGLNCPHLFDYQTRHQFIGSVNTPDVLSAKIFSFSKNNATGTMECLLCFKLSETLDRSEQAIPYRKDFQAVLR